MPATPTYSPISHAPATARTQLATTCRYARYAEIHESPHGDFTRELYRPGPPSCCPSGTWRLRELPYRALAPVGAVGAPTIVHCSLYIVHCWTFTFSAKERDSETGLSYFGSRYYSSDLSIWLSVDPMAAKYASTSPYAYCRNNPIVLVDPNGTFDTRAEARRYRRKHHTGGIVRKNSPDNQFAGTYSIINKRKSLSYTKPNYTQNNASTPLIGFNSEGIVVSAVAHDPRTGREKVSDFDTRFTNISIDILQSAYLCLISPINDTWTLIKGQDIYGTPVSKADKKWAAAGLLTFGGGMYLKGIRHFRKTNKYIVPEIGTSVAGLSLDIRSGYKTYQNKKNNEEKDN